MADALTSAFAIVALSLGKWANLGWMDPVTGLVGALIIFKWGISLGRTTAFELLDFAPTSKYEDEIYAFVSKNPNLSILDLHVWCIGRGKMSCILTLQAAVPYDLGVLRSDILTRFQLAHLTIELRQATVKEPKLEPNKT
jgi:Co/Zn/Cd efflux system component